MFTVREILESEIDTSFSILGGIYNGESLIFAVFEGEGFSATRSTWRYDVSSDIVEEVGFFAISRTFRSLVLH